MRTGPDATALHRSPIHVPIATIMLFQVAALAVRSFVQSVLVDGGYDTVPARHLGAIAGFAVLAILLLPFATTIRSMIATHFLSPGSWTRLILASCSLGAVLWLGQMLALLAITPMSWADDELITMPTAPNYVLACDRAALLLLAIPLMAVVTPLVEEVINRGLFLGALLRRGRASAILISAMLFAVLHPLETIPSAFLFGIIAALQMLHYRTLWAPLIAHATFNLLVEAGRTCIHGTWQPGAFSLIRPGAPMLIMASLVICAVLAWWLAARVDAGVETEGRRPGGG